MSVSSYGIQIDRDHERFFNIYKFDVDNPDTAFKAVLDIPGFMKTGMDPSREETCSENCLKVYAFTGFPYTATVHEVKQLNGFDIFAKVGSRYSINFKTDKELIGSISVKLTVKSIKDTQRFKEVVWTTESYGTRVGQVGPSCFENPVQVPLRNSFTRVSISRGTLGEGKLTLKYQGYDVLDSMSLIGSSNYCCCAASTALFCPLLCVFVPGAIPRICSALENPPECVIAQMRKLQQYCNSYRTTRPLAQQLPTYQTQVATSQEFRALVTRHGQQETSGTTGSASGPMSNHSSNVQTHSCQESEAGENGELKVAIPVSEETKTDPRARRLAQWYKLYEDGILTSAEFENEKRKILSEAPLVDA